MSDTARAVRIQLLIALMCVALVTYFVLLGRLAVAMIASGRAAAVGLGLAVLIMPVIGLWAMITTLRAGFAHQKLARLIAADGMELDAGALPVSFGGDHSITIPAVRAVRERVAAWVSAQPGWSVIGIAESPITGPAGNREFLIYARRGR